ncbi:ABC transporter ATP-binding protein [Dehalococcoides mccartyi]|uniref:ABC transporter ATP-binding protein n=1 Tax=Dehalococcoides mccartyi TaxID=61435 RepID=A0A2J1DUX2_9CHLR|nr:ABC transporter ATP-binding protein [Dehalococcoides mccartyi]
MLNIQNLSKSFGVRSLYTGVNLNIGARDRLALLGPNGSGKTTLFEMIAGRLEPDEGKIILRRGTTVGYLEQDIKPSSKQPLLKAVSSASDRLRSLSHKISLLQGELAEEKDGSESNRLMNELGELQHSFEALGGYNAEQEAKLILAGLGSNPPILTAPCMNFPAAG